MRILSFQTSEGRMKFLLKYSPLLAFFPTLTILILELFWTGYGIGDFFSLFDSSLYSLAWYLWIPLLVLLFGFILNLSRVTCVISIIISLVILVGSFALVLVNTFLGIILQSLGDVISPSNEIFSRYFSETFLQYPGSAISAGALCLLLLSSSLYINVSFFKYNESYTRVGILLLGLIIPINFYISGQVPTKAQLMVQVDRVEVDRVAHIFKPKEINYFPIGVDKEQSSSGPFSTNIGFIYEKDYSCPENEGSMILYQYMIKTKSSEMASQIKNESIASTDKIRSIGSAYFKMNNTDINSEINLSSHSPRLGRDKIPLQEMVYETTWETPIDGEYHDFYYLQIDGVCFHKSSDIAEVSDQTVIEEIQKIISSIR